MGIKTTLSYGQVSVTAFVDDEFSRLGGGYDPGANARTHGRTVVTEKSTGIAGRRRRCGSHAIRFRCSKPDNIHLSDAG